MTREEFDALVRARDEAQRRYFQLRSARDEHERASSDEVQEHRDAIQRLRDEHERTVRECQDAWREYRRLDREIPRARTELLLG